MEYFLGSFNYLLYSVKHCACFYVLHKKTHMFSMRQPDSKVLSRSSNKYCSSIYIQHRPYVYTLLFI